MISFRSWLENNEKDVEFEIKNFNSLLTTLPQVYKFDPKTNKDLTPEQTWDQTKKDPKYLKSLVSMKAKGVPLIPDDKAIVNMIKNQKSVAPVKPIA